MSTNNGQAGTQESSNSAKQDKPTLALPSVDDAQATKVDLSTGFGTAKFDALGPVVVNVDGTLSRITNWDAMAEIEQKNTLRILGKRNKERLENLKAQQEGDAK